MTQDGEGFIARWSRRKLASSVEAVSSQAAPAAPVVEAVAPPLPALDSLTFESDFEAFMRARIDESVRRAALKKLFADPRFNVMDGLDVYIDDYAEGEPIPPELLARLEHAKSTLFGPEPQAGPASEATGAAAGVPDSPAAPDADRSKESDGAAGQDA
ncbi:MAG: DUF3306 domain-containing protein [Betaproteobacteria bacterium]|nr:MAG: DUF3306 domain-containing protein [Betaproteobacteria bacterium]